MIPTLSLFACCFVQGGRGRGRNGPGHCQDATLTKEVPPVESRTEIPKTLEGKMRHKPLAFHNNNFNANLICRFSFKPFFVDVIVPKLLFPIVAFGFMNAGVFNR